jgi:hypothetical protein
MPATSSRHHKIFSFFWLRKNHHLCGENVGHPPSHIISPGLLEDRRYSIPCDLELVHARSPGMKMGAGRQMADHSESLSVICISLMKEHGEFNSSCKPGEMILRIIFIEIIPKLSNPHPHR